MCGICGIFGANRPEEERRAIVHKMMDRLAHRGPDDEGLHSGNLFTFGHRRLAIIDLQQGHQPMRSVDGRYTLILNGEIYNYLEWRQRLSQQGVRFRTNSDTEVLLHLLIRQGAEALLSLNGMFAFAFHDSHGDRWLLGRDPFGIKPLYFHVLPDEIVFASEIKALFDHPAIRPERDWQALQHYFTFQFCLGDRTLFAGIRKLEPGFYIEGQGGRMVRSVRYWDADYHIDEYHSERYFQDQLLATLQDSVRLQVQSDVPVGAHLSGGIDSSIIATLATQQLQDKMPLFTGRFIESAAYDESRYARILAERIGAECHDIIPTAEAFPDLLPQLIYAMDEPVAGPGLYPQYWVNRHAARHVKVVLGGQGGDEIFGGYARYLIGYLGQALKGAIFETQEEGKHIVTLGSIIPNLAILQQYQPLMQHFWQEGMFAEMDARYFRLIDRSPDIEHLLTDEARSLFSKAEVFADFQAIFNHPDTRSFINKMTHFDLKTLLPALLQVEDRVSMAVSVESRVPFLDTRIVNLVTSMPPAIKFKGGQTKYILKQTFRDLLPGEIIQRKDKMGFPVPLKEWMAGGQVRAFVCDTLLGATSLQRGLFRPEGLQALIDREGAFGRQLWGALCLELWHQTFLDGR